MPLTRQQKENLAASYEKELARAPHVFLIDYRGITVPEVTDLRARLRESGSSYLVVKNRIARRAFKGGALEQLDERLVGPVAAAYSMSDPVTLAKTLTEFGKQVPALEFRGGLVEGRPVAADQILEIASLPSREQLVAKLLFLLQSPVSRLARTLGAVGQRFVVVLEQIRAQKEKKVN